MDKKKPYVPPRLTSYDSAGLPKWLQFLRDNLAPDVRNPHLVTPAYTAVVDKERKYVEVSESFCKLVGYKAEELIGKRYDELTAPETADIQTTYNLFARLGYMHGLWTVVHRTGYRILIRYESWLRSDANIQSNIELVQTIHLSHVDGEQTSARGERRAKRYGFVASVEVTDLQSNIQLQERTADLSLYGCCVKVAANKPFSSGTRVWVRISYNDETFAAVGRIAYANSDGDMGIAFVRIDGDDQVILDKWIDELREVEV
jgi:PAS domain S-box-containing protein